MDAKNRECNNCGASDWTKIVEEQYPDRRRERDRTVKNVYKCNECGKEGRHFIHRDGGPEQFTGEMRE